MNCLTSRFQTQVWTQAYLISIKLLVGKYRLFITHLDQVICCLYTFTALNVRSPFSMKGI